MIDIIIPVFRGLAQTRRCIESVLAIPQRVPIEVVVIDDCSPEPEISAYLEGLARDGRVTLLKNETNRGFVQSVNRGMALHDDRDVILLNSDTEVANDWVDRLLAATYASPRVATATPFSNNATICSYPFASGQGRLPGTLGLAELDRVFAATNAGRSIDLPTAVGFCMLIRRDCLREVGMFDARRFGRGYGEENDFCMRAAKAGWRNILAADVFVFHEGEVSFLDEKLALSQAANDALIEVHPEYTQKVRAFIVAEPARELRGAVDRARLAKGPEEAESVLRERAEEFATLMARFRELETFAAKSDAHVLELLDGLHEAQGLVAERNHALEKVAEDRALLEAQREEVSAGLARAEALAFARLDELSAIRSYWLWPLYRRLMSWQSHAVPGRSRHQED